MHLTLLHQISTAGDTIAVTGLAAIGGPMSWAVPGLLVAFTIGGVVAYGLYKRRQKQAREASLQRLVARYPGWARTNQPCGYAVKSLAGQTVATPKGDRRFGMRHGVGGPITLAINGTDTPCRVALFQWVSEKQGRKRTASGPKGARNQRKNRTYQEQTQMVGIVRMPFTFPTYVTLRSESVLGKLGLSRGGDQVESSEFNRRFRIDGGDRTTTVQLLDANFQQVMVERYSGRTMQVNRDVLVLGGSPEHRDDGLTGVIGELPAILQDMEALVGHVPPPFWRAIGAGGQAAPPPAPPSS